MPTYLIKNKHTGVRRMVEAPQPATAIRHVAESDYEVTKPTAAEAARLAMDEGIRLETVETSRPAPGLHPNQLPLTGVDPPSQPEAVATGLDPGA